MTASSTGLATASPNPAHVHRVNREHSHLPFLDAFRGSLAFWVLAGHTLLATGANLPLVNRLPEAVEIFMCVSGFLMAFYFRLREDREPWGSPGTWQSFYLRRFFRIAPAYYLLLAVALIFRSHYQQWHYDEITTFPPPWAKVMHDSPALPALTWQDVLVHLTFLFGFIPKYCNNNSLPDWSIGLEMQFYLALPFIMLLFRRTGYLIASLLLLGIWAVANHYIAVYASGSPKLLGPYGQPTFLPLRLNCFLIGILLAEAYYWYRLKEEGRQPRTALLLALAALGLALATSGKPMTGAVALAAIMVGYPAKSAAGILSTAICTLRRFFDSPPFIFLGDTSYSVYLLHNLVLLQFGAWLFSSHPALVHLPPLRRFAILLLPVIVITYPIAYLIHRFVERPGIAVGRNIIRHLRSALPPGKRTYLPGTAPEAKVQP